MPLSASTSWVIKDIVTDLMWHPVRKWGSRSTDLIKKIIIHQSLSDSTTRNINSYHVNPNHISSRGCPHICYHYSIEKDGTTYKCNSPAHVVWHAKGFNIVSLGILVIGNFDGPSWTGKSAPTPQQLNSLNRLTKYLKQVYRLDNSAIFGHPNKENCPGNILDEWVEAKRNE